MIPRHRPPFGPLSLVGSALRGILDRVSVEQLERAYCETLQVPHAVWLPSARFGITRSIQLLTLKDATVFCPVFNCGAVHHAADQTGRVVEYADCGANSFLMSCHGCAPASHGHAVILSEMFGQRFSNAALNQSLVADAAVRVFDMAMAIPTASDMERLSHDDLAVASFGLGKSLYAGWGGMAFTKSRELADDLRACRNSAVEQFGLAAQAKCFVKMVARTTAHEPFIYAHVRRLQTASESRTSGRSSFSTASHEWRRPAASYHLQLAVKNLATASQSIKQRLRLAEIYRRELPAALVPPETFAASDVALSHFPIRVPAADRDAVRALLRGAGIDVGTLFPFPRHQLNASEFPNAKIIADEVLNLPLSCQLCAADVLRISRSVASSVAVPSNAFAEMNVAA